MKNRNALKILLTLAGLIAVVLVATFAVNAFCNTYHMSLINTSLLYFITIAGITLNLGYGGFFGFSSIAFLGLGSYLCAYLTTKTGISPILAVLIATVVTTAVVYLLGLALLRLNGAFFMFGSMGLLFIATTIFTNWVEFTGGPNGIYGIPTLQVGGFRFDSYYKWFPLLVILAILMIFILVRIKNTSLGRSLMAVRDDETAACTLGVNVYQTKVIAFAMGGAFAGFAGALYALHNGVVSASLFNFNVQLSFVIMVMLGGVQSPIGTLAGAFLVNALPEVLRFADRYINIIYGVMVILLMIFMPTGLAGLFSEGFKKARQKWGNEGKSKQ